MDGAYFRVHHFARQLASPFPLVAAIGAKTKKIEIGTAAIDVRYENPHSMVEDAGAARFVSIMRTEPLGGNARRIGSCQRIECSKENRK